MPAGGYLARLDALRVWPGYFCLEHGAGVPRSGRVPGYGGDTRATGAEVRRRYWGDGRAARMEVTAYLRRGRLPVCY